MLSCICKPKAATQADQGALGNKAHNHSNAVQQQQCHAPPTSQAAATAPNNCASTAGSLSESNSYELVQYARRLETELASESARAIAAEQSLEDAKLANRRLSEHTRRLEKQMLALRAQPCSHCHNVAESVSPAAFLLQMRSVGRSNSGSSTSSNSGSSTSSSSSCATISVTGQHTHQQLKQQTQEVQQQEHEGGNSARLLDEIQRLRSKLQQTSTALAQERQMSHDTQLSILHQLSQKMQPNPLYSVEAHSTATHTQMQQPGQLHAIRTDKIGSSDVQAQKVVLRTVPAAAAAAAAAAATTTDSNIHAIAALSSNRLQHPQLEERLDSKGARCGLDSMHVQELRSLFENLGLGAKPALLQK